MERGALRACLFVALVAGSALSGDIDRRTLSSSFAETPPTLDGHINDACWTQTAEVPELFLQHAWQSYPKRTEAWVCHDATALYFAFRCREPEPEKLTSKGADGSIFVRGDDSVQVFFKRGDLKGEYRMFAVNPAGRRQSQRVWATGYDDDWRVFWQTATYAGRDEWTAELRIPFHCLEMRGIPGERKIELSFARNDRVKGRGGYAVWPCRPQHGWDPKYGTLLLAVPEAGHKPSALSKGVAGPAISVPARKPDDDSLTVVEKVLVADSRIVRGFCGAPVDGTVFSYGWHGGPAEYEGGNTASGIAYAFNGNEGLHITLADERGVDAVVVRGGARAGLYSGPAMIEGPGKAREVWRFPGGRRSSRAVFKGRVPSRRFSFFDVGDGALGNVSFFRTGTRTVVVGGPALRPSDNASDKEANDAIAERFGPDHRRAFALAGTGETSVTFEAGRYVHFVTVPFVEETALDAVILRADVAGTTGPCEFTVRVQDPVNPRLELCGPDMQLSGVGRLAVMVDFPDQIVPAKRSLWISMSFQASIELKELRLHLVKTLRDKALPEALAHRKLLMRSFFSAASERRRWNSMGRDLDAIFKKDRYGPPLKEVLATVDHAMVLDAKDPLVRQYHDWVYRWYKRVKIAPPQIEQVPGAPEWAVVLRQSWRHYREIVRWWLDSRLVPTGEFGGQVNDDTDMFQQFANLPMVEDGELATRLRAAAGRLAELAHRRHLSQGVNSKITDPLHAYEEGINHDALMAWWHYGDPVYLERCMVNARNTEKMTMRAESGGLHFKWVYFDAADLNRNRPPEKETSRHALLLHPSLELIRYNHNPRALAHVRAWAESFLNLLGDGVDPGYIEMPSGKRMGKGRYVLAGGAGGRMGVMGALFDVTGEKKFLAPFLRWVTETDRIFKSGWHLPEVARWHGLQGIKNPRLFHGRYNRWATEFIATGKRASLVEGIKNDIAFRQFWPDMHTTVEPFTDRVDFYDSYNTVLAYTGGLAGRNHLWRTHAVSWEGLGNDFAALVMEASRNALKVLLYNFGDAPRRGQMRIWRLGHGLYDITMGPDRNGDDLPDSVSRREKVELFRGSSVEIVLPLKTAMVLEIAQVERLDPICDRADLALSRREIRVTKGAVHGVVHNIGSREVSQVVVVLKDAEGRVVSRKELGSLAAPIDLVPRMKRFVLDGARADVKGWSVVVDPENQTEEIYEGNNSVRLVN